MNWVNKTLALEGLRAALRLIENQGWIQGSYCDAKSGDPLDPAARCFCMMGALRRALNVSIEFEADELEEDHPYRLAFDALQEAVGACAMSIWQDAKKRRKWEVVAAFVRAHASLQAA